jgi:hypothetical protein
VRVARQRRVLAALVGSGLMLAASATPANASVSLGETFDPDGCGSDTYIQTADPGNRYRVPLDGVITSWSYEADSTPPGEARFKVGRTAPGADLTMNTNVTIVGQSALENPAASTLNTYATQIPVKAGDRIGEYVTDDCSRQDSAYTDHFFDADVQPGITDLFSQETYQQDISAVLEPTNTFSFAGTTRNKKKGTATLTVNVPNPGELTGSGSGVKAASAGAVISKSVQAGSAQLVIKAKGKKRKKLNARGKVKLSVTITYTPTSGKPSTQSTTVKLKKKLP